MAEKRRPPGSPKGAPKPSKRVLDPKFPDRLKQAMTAAKLTVPELAKKARCTRAVLGKYLSGKSTTIEALLLFDIADALETVTARWLATGLGDPPQKADAALESIKKIIDAARRQYPLQ